MKPSLFVPPFAAIYGTAAAAAVGNHEAAAARQAESQATVPAESRFASFGLQFQEALLQDVVNLWNSDMTVEDIRQKRASASPYTLNIQSLADIAAIAQRLGLDPNADLDKRSEEASGANPPAKGASSGKLGLDKLGLDKLGLDKLGLDKLGLDKLSPEKLGLDKLSPEKLGLNKLGLDKLGLDKLGLNKVNGLVKGGTQIAQGVTGTNKGQPDFSKLPGGTKAKDGVKPSRILDTVKGAVGKGGKGGKDIKEIKKKGANFVATMFPVTSLVNKLGLGPLAPVTTLVDGLLLALLGLGPTVGKLLLQAGLIGEK